MIVTIHKQPDKGKIVYEYNPLFNYRISQELTDLNTPQFNFSLKYPVDIQCQNSYDGSVNLILNDGLNKARLINTRFRVNENNTYEVINRASNNEANLYDKEQFDLDTTLVKKVNKIPTIKFESLDGSGQLPCGNYNFYFKYEDDDGNETDFIGESGSVVCHVGNLLSPSSIRSGLENENSRKAINFVITDIDGVACMFFDRKDEGYEFGGIGDDWISFKLGFDSVRIEWDEYDGKAWYCGHTYQKRSIVLSTPDGDVTLPAFVRECTEPIFSNGVEIAPPCIGIGLDYKEKHYFGGHFLTLDEALAGLQAALPEGVIIKNLE